jgi:pyruvate/2-oxoglutarate dehydrogenase complex dihydrolipoamide dehydrogenase (E3) component
VTVVDRGVDDGNKASPTAAADAPANAPANAPVTMLPDDEYNRALVGHVHPPGWTNPTPSGRYNMVVIGGGTAGLVSAVGAAGLGAKVALIERHLMGGDCLNVGCVPSKGLISAARRVAEIRDAAEFGIHVPGGVEVDFGAIMERMRRLRARIAPNDSAQRFSDLGVDVYLGGGAFTGPDTVEVAGQTLQFKKAVIATGGRAAGLPIPGLEETGYLTNETLFSLTELPRRLAIIGSGPIGCEMAQSFARFGSQVTLIEMAEHILMREDGDAAAIVQAAFERDGIDMRFSAKTLRVEQDGADKVLHLEIGGQAIEVRADAILVGVGRAPNVQGLGLEAAGVSYDERLGVSVDDNLRTTNKNIFAAGDISSRFKFTHTADFMARIVIRNALFAGKAKASALTIPWCTYTDPEIAHVGMYEEDAVEKGLQVDTYVQPLADVDRAILDGEEAGFVKVLTEKGKDRILGATIVARHAGEMISELSVAMVGKVGLGTVANTIHPYPTQAEAIRRVGDRFNRTRLTPLVASLMKSWLGWTR